MDGRANADLKSDVSDVALAWAEVRCSVLAARRSLSRASFDSWLSCGPPIENLLGSVSQEFLSEPPRAKCTKADHVGANSRAGH